MKKSIKLKSVGATQLLEFSSNALVGSDKQPTVLHGGFNASEQPAEPNTRGSGSAPSSFGSVFSEVHTFIHEFKPSKEYESDAYYLSELGEMLERKFSPLGVKIKSWRHLEAHEAKNENGVPTLFGPAEEHGVLEISRNHIGFILQVKNGKPVPL